VNYRQPSEYRPHQLMLYLKQWDIEYGLGTNELTGFTVQFRDHRPDINVLTSEGLKDMVYKSGNQITKIILN